MCTLTQMDFKVSCLSVFLFFFQVIMTSLKCRYVKLRTRIESNARVPKIEVQNMNWLQELPNSLGVLERLKKQQTCLCSYVGFEICFLTVTWYRSRGYRKRLLKLCILLCFLSKRLKGYFRLRHHLLHRQGFVNASFVDI